MSEYVWPGVVLIVAAMWIFRAKKPQAEKKLKKWLEKRLKPLEEKVEQQIPKVLVDRVNALTEDMKALKPRQIYLEEQLKEAQQALTTIRNTTAARRIAGVESPT